MADLLPNTPLPTDTMVDLYAETGIQPGTKIRVVNIGSNRIRLYTKGVEPDQNADGYIILTSCKSGSSSVTAENDNGDTGAWAYSENQKGLINVQVVL